MALAATRQTEMERRENDQLFTDRQLVTADYSCRVHLIRRVLLSINRSNQNAARDDNRESRSIAGAYDGSRRKIRLPAPFFRRRDRSLIVE